MESYKKDCRFYRRGKLVNRRGQLPKKCTSCYTYLAYVRPELMKEES